MNLAVEPPTESAMTEVMMFRRKLRRFLFLFRYCLRHPSFLGTCVLGVASFGKAGCPFQTCGNETGYEQFHRVYRGLAARIERYPYFSTMDPRKYELIYSIVRILRLLRVVKTGVASGVSRYFILDALRQNGLGQLISIDTGLSESDGMTLSVPIGFFVPEEFRDRWSLKIGMTEEELPKLRAEDPPFQLFLHDSDHSYDNMSWEFDFAWRGLERGGMLISDNVELDLAFRDFMAKTGCPGAMLMVWESPSSRKREIRGEDQKGGSCNHMKTWWNPLATGLICSAHELPDHRLNLTDGSRLPGCQETESPLAADVLGYEDCRSL